MKTGVVLSSFYLSKLSPEEIFRLKKGDLRLVSVTATGKMRGGILRLLPARADASGQKQFYDPVVSGSPPQEKLIACNWRSPFLHTSKILLSNANLPASVIGLCNGFRIDYIPPSRFSFIVSSKLILS